MIRFLIFPVIFFFLPSTPVSASPLERPSLQAEVVVVYPLFTQAAYGSGYGKGGFYQYYAHHCRAKDQTVCLTVPLPPPTQMIPDYVASGEGYQVLSALGYPYITDADVDKNPRILDRYKTVVLLHNEYMTSAEFKAIQAHSNVIYLYPNSGYAQVKVDYTAKTIALVRGHGYQAPENGFDWDEDNTHSCGHNDAAHAHASKMSCGEYDTDCSDWQFYRTTNGWMLNCYPERVIQQNSDILTAVQMIVHGQEPMQNPRLRKRPS